MEYQDRGAGKICSWISDLFYVPYFCQLCKPVLALKGVFTAQVLCPGLAVTLKSTSGMIVEPGLLWVCVVMDCGSHRENLDCSKVAVMGGGVPVYCL